MKQATLLGLFPLIVLLAQPATSTDPGGDKIPITTSSEAAKKEFLAGRELADNLKATDAIAHFDKALELDPNFASAELARFRHREGVPAPPGPGHRARRQGFRRRAGCNPGRRSRRGWQCRQDEGIPGAKRCSVPER